MGCNFPSMPSIAVKINLHFYIWPGCIITSHPRNNGYARLSIPKSEKATSVKGVPENYLSMIILKFVSMFSRMWFKTNYHTRHIRMLIKLYRTRLPVPCWWENIELNPGDIYMRQWTLSSYAQVLVCLLLGVKPLLEPMLTHFCPMGTNFNGILTYRYDNSLSENYFWNVVCKMSAILLRPQYVKWGGLGGWLHYGAGANIVVIIEMSSFWWNFHHWHRKFLCWQFPVKTMMKNSSKWHTHFSDVDCAMVVELNLS